MTHVTHREACAILRGMEWRKAAAEVISAARDQSKPEALKLALAHFDQLAIKHAAEIAKDREERAQTYLGKGTTLTTEENRSD